MLEHGEKEHEVPADNFKDPERQSPPVPAPGPENPAPVPVPPDE